VQSVDNLQSLHLISFLLLNLQYFRYQKCNLDFLKKLIYFAIAVIILQVVFFPNGGDNWSGWDDIFIPSFGLIQRLSILGFVSNSLAVMILPFFIFLLFKDELKKYDIILLFALIIVILFTFSRIGYTLTLIIFFFRYPTLITVTILFSALCFMVFIKIGSVIDLIDSAIIRGGVTNNPRLWIWRDNIALFDKSSYILGQGVMLRPSDNTYISLFLGIGFLGCLVMFMMIFSLIKYKLLIYFPGFLLLCTILIAIMTFDIFSQRKIIFTFALVGAYYNVKKKSSHHRR